MNSTAILSRPSSPSAELFRALGVLCESPVPGHARVASALGLPGAPDPAEYATVFLFQSYPYASVHLGPEGMLGGEARDRVAGFWRAVGLVPPAEPDHLAALLGLYATLVDAEADEREEARVVLRREARRALLWEHVLSWALPYLWKLREIAGPYHRAWADLLERALLDEAAELPAPGRLPLHLRTAPPLPEPDASADEWVAAILAPVRSGMVIVRGDLASAARDLGLALRMGERAYSLKALFAQDAPATLAWLSTEAQGWMARHDAVEPLVGQIALFWRSRAEATLAALHDPWAAAAEVRDDVDPRGR
ncbi:MAG: molecular chaperone TorD family protein [Candidatus Limnocylindrales bacterium]